MRRLDATHIAAALTVVCSLAAAPGFAQAPRFDGSWNVVMICPAHDGADDDAKGYTHRFSAEVRGSQIQGTHGKEGEPGWHYLHGRIQEDGSATLRLEGVVNNPKYAINKAERGKRYSYRIKAQFEEQNGIGQRITSRACEFRFTR